MASIRKDHSVDKAVGSATEAVEGIRSGASLAVGGFGVSGIPSALIAALLEAGVGDLSVVSNNCGVDDWGLGLLLRAGRIARMTSSYVGENKEFERQYLAGDLEVELVPQGTLAERLRAGGVGIPAFYTATGVGTQVAAGGLPLRYDRNGSVAKSSPPREVREFGGRTYVLEDAIHCDVALVHAWMGDRHGNLVYREAAQNFNPLCAMAGRLTVAEVEHLVDAGDITPREIHTPGVFVQRVLHVPDVEKRIERRTTRPEVTLAAVGDEVGS
jgi:3-oxoacid CoA-transferase subunit A